MADVLVQEYVPSPDADLLIVRWWQRLLELGALDRVFSPAARSLSRFFEMVRPPDQRLAYAADARGLWFGFLLVPILSGTTVSVWIDPRKEGTADATEALRIAYGAAVAEFPVLVAMTDQATLSPEHARWGYELLGRLPAGAGGDDAWLVTLTPAGYEAAVRMAGAA